MVPSPRHLWEMKQVLYDRPYENGVKREDYPGFRWLEAVPLRYSVHLDRSEDVMALFGMTPYAWKTPRAGGGPAEGPDGAGHGDRLRHPRL
ncbi:MAG: hypothetical protein ACLT3D_00040 [Lawsonibacter sp.]